MEKRTAHIDDWAYIPELNKLAGLISRHIQNRGQHPEGGLTSTVVKLDVARGFCETQNTIYTLGKRAQEIV